MTTLHIPLKNNEEFKKDLLSSRELNDISMQMFRVIAISEMVFSATSVFADNIKGMLDGSIVPGFELIKNSDCSQLCKLVKGFDYEHGFQNREVLRLELQGNNYIKNMMTMLWRAVSKGDDENHPFERYVFGEISENYRRVYNKSEKNLYDKYQLICDALSGMTERHLINKHDEYKALENVAS